MVDLRTRPFTAAQAAQLVADRTQGDGWIHLAPAIPTSVQHLLAQACVNFVDLAGNLFVSLGDAYTAQVEGRAPVTTPSRQGLARADVQVLLSLMLNSSLLQATVRELAGAAGVSKSAAANSVNALVQQDLLRRAGDGLVFAPVGVLDTLLGLYENVLRPKLIIGRYAAAERDPVALEQRLSTDLERMERRWSFGGHVAAWRLMPHHRGDRTCLVVEDADAATAAALRLLPKADGPVLLMRSPGPFVFDAAPAPTHGAQTQQLSQQKNNSPHTDQWSCTQARPQPMGQR
jgi:hypothetical protein